MLIETFDREAPQLYDIRDRERGFVEVTNRQGEAQRFPLLSLSIGIATTDHRTFGHQAEAVAIATELKAFAKRTPGSSLAIDRRTG